MDASLALAIRAMVADSTDAGKWRDRVARHAYAARPMQWFGVRAERDEPRFSLHGDARGSSIHLAGCTEVRAGPTAVVPGSSDACCRCIVEVPPGAAERPDRAQPCRSVEWRRFSTADMPPAEVAHCNGGNRHQPLSSTRAFAHRYRFALHAADRALTVNGHYPRSLVAAYLATPKSMS
jgi:hypothetical protein